MHEAWICNAVSIPPLTILIGRLKKKNGGLKKLAYCRGVKIRVFPLSKSLNNRGDNKVCS